MKQADDFLKDFLLIGFFVGNFRHHHDFNVILSEKVFE